MTKGQLLIQHSIITGQIIVLSFIWENINMQITVSKTFFKFVGKIAAFVWFLWAVMLHLLYRYLSKYMKW